MTIKQNPMLYENGYYHDKENTLVTSLINIFIYGLNLTITIAIHLLGTQYQYVKAS